MSGEGRFIDALMAGNLKVDGDVVAKTLKSTTGNDKYMRLNFDSHPVFKGKVLADGTTLAHGAPTGGTGDENLMMFPDGILEWHVLGTQTILAPAPSATGLNIGMDQTANDGIEVCPGILASNKLAFVVGTDPAFFARMKFTIADVSGTDDCAFGFRKAEAYQAAIDNYDEMAVLNVISGNITIETILNNTATVSTDTTNNWADGETHVLEVRVSAAGVVTYKIDGLSPIVTAAFTFDTDEVVVPFFYYLHDTTSPGAITLREFECGLQ
jgi:hypothetical protein